MISVFQTAQKLRKPVPEKQPTPADALRQKIIQWQKTGDKKLQSQLLVQLQPTIKSALHSFAPGKQESYRVPAAKLTLSTLNTYDPTKNISVNTYVYHNLQRLNRIRRQRQNIIHIPQNIVYEQNIINNKKAQLQDALGRQPTNIQLADATGISTKRLQKLQSVISGVTINDSSAVDESGQSTFGTDNLTDKDYMDYVYSSVDPINQKIIEWSTPYYGKKQLPGQEIAKKLKLSPGAVSQRKNQIAQLLSKTRGLLQ